MYGLISLGVALLAAFLFLVLWPVLIYLKDSNGLRKYPALTPFSGISNLPYMILSAQGHRSEHLAELHKEHPIIRIGPNALSFGKARAIKEIYGHGTRCTKDDFYAIMAGTHFNLADVIDKRDHQRKRKILSSAYAIQNLEGWEFKVVDKVERLFLQLDRLCTQPLDAHGAEHPRPEDLNVDFKSWMSYFTQEAIADIGMSAVLGFLDRGHDFGPAEKLDGSITEASYSSAIYSALTVTSHLGWSMRWFPIVRDWIFMTSSKYRELIRAGSDYDRIVLHLLRQRMRRYDSGEKLEDFFQALMEDKDGRPHQMPFGEIFAELNVMLNAGSVTTAIALQNVVYLLLRHPDVLRKLRSELDNVVDEDEKILPFDAIKDLPYLRACLDESLRLYPPTTFGLPRKTPPEGCGIMDEFVAGNLQVSTSAYVAHRDDDIFPNPESFIPERWLGEDGKKLQASFITFSAGARGCIGRNISYLEQTILVASLFHNYELALSSPGWTLDTVEHFQNVPKALPIKIWRRGREAELI